MIKAIIVDDEAKTAKALGLLLKEHCPEVLLMHTANTAADAIHKIKDLAPDLVFLDIQMPFNDGFSILDKIGEIKFEIIFTTAHSDYAVKAFKKNAIDYILKPVRSEELINAVNKCGEKLKQATDLHKLQNQLNFFKQALTINKIPIHSRNEVLLIDREDIIRFEADGNYTIIHLLSGKKITSTKFLSDYEKSVPEDVFIRIHKKNLINRFYIKTIKKGEGQIIMADGSILEVSRLKKAAIFSALTGS